MSMSNRGTLKVLVLAAFLALTPARTATADCLPTTTIAFLGVGFDFFVGGAYAEFAISHDWLNGTSLVTLGTGALCRLAPEPWASLCNASIAANLIWIKLEDQGSGVFVKLDMFGVWVPSSASSVCAPASSSGPPAVSTCGNVMCGSKQVCLAAGSLCPGDLKCPSGESVVSCGDPPEKSCNSKPSCPTCPSGETLVRGSCVKGEPK